MFLGLREEFLIIRFLRTLDLYIRVDSTLAWRGADRTEKCPLCSGIELMDTDLEGF